jgi:ATP-dependent exoDNAse (exonuclease V) alpha subunit
VCAGGGILPIVGRAGTSKTFLMDAVRTAFETANLLLPPEKRMRVRGLAPTGIASMELHAGAGVDSATIDRFLVDLDNGRDRLEPGDVVIVDEAGLLGTRKFARLLAHANQVEAKLVPVGDDRQLQSIDTGGWFRGLKQRLGAAELTINRRQSDSLDRKAVELIRQGLAAEAMQLYRDGGRVTVAKTAVEAHDAMTADWWASFAAGENAVMLAFRRVEVDRLNDLARQLMAADGRLTGPTIENQGRAFQMVVCGLNRRS